MTDKQINITIAEACGWHTIAFNKGWIKAGDGETQGTIPDYCNDLNAMHEAEKALSEEQWENYNFILCNLVGGYSKTNKEAIHASSRQKAEAFLETIKNNS